MSSAWSQLEQLLTCAICLDRFKNPKLLPCQHTFCGEPCMEGLVDYARRQIKCPECRAEHRIPYQGIQTFPTNVTLMRFLELHQSITGEEPEPVPSMMERCGVCTEKSMVERCVHCEKKICTECKEAHLDILKREISRINSQVRRALTRLEDTISQTDRNSERLVKNQIQIKDEIEETVRRFVKDIKDKENKLLHELDEYVATELTNLAKLKEDLDIESKTIGANCDLIEKHVIEQNEAWTDVELVEYKDIFNKSLEFLRNFDTDSSDFSKRIKFQTCSDIDMLRRNLVNFGELKLPQPDVDQNVQSSQLSSQSSGTSLNVPQQNMLMRSQSDHRLAAQFARREGRLSEYASQSRLNAGGFSDTERDGRNDRSTSPTGYGRNRRESTISRYNVGDSRDNRTRYGRDSDSYRGWNRDEDSDSGPHFRSRFMREKGSSVLGLDEADTDYGTSHRSVRFEEPSTQPVPKVFDIQTAPRGPLSGVVKLSDSAHFMERLHENEARSKVDAVRKEEEAKLLSSTPTQNPVYQPPPMRRQTSRQVSEDEIEKQKKANKAEAAAAAASASTTASLVSSTNTSHQPVNSTSVTAPSQSKSGSSNLTSQPESRYMPRRVTTLRDEDDKGRRGTSDSSSSQSTQSTIRDTDTSTLDDVQIDDEESNALRLARRRRSLTAGTELEPRETPAKATATSARAVRPSMAKTASVEERDVLSDNRRNGRTGADMDNVRQQTTLSSTSSYYNRMSRQSVAEEPEEKADPEDDDDEEEEEESESDGEAGETDSEPEPQADKNGATRQMRNSGSPSNYSNTKSNQAKDAVLHPTVEELLTRSAQVRRDSVEFRSRLDPDGKIASRLKSQRTLDDLSKPSKVEAMSDHSSSKYSLASGDYLRTSKYSDTYSPTQARTSGTSNYATNRTNPSLRDPSATEDTFKYNRRDSLDGGHLYKSSTDGPSYSRVSRSKSSHSIISGGHGASDEEEDAAANTSYKTRQASTEGSTYKGSGYQYRTREPRESRQRSPVNDDHSSGPSAWSQYLRNKYASSRKSSLSGSTGSSSRPSVLTKSKSSHAVYNRTASDSSDEEGTNYRQGSRDSETYGNNRRGNGSGYGFALPRSMYLQKRRMAVRVGTRGTEPGCFTWPRGVAVGLDNNIVVADSSNHRIQVFDSTGRFLFEFGSYGSNEGEFDCPAGVAVNRIGQFIVSDRYNHRIQIFDPSGRFLRAFGCEGRSDGRFSYPWGITTDSLGFIYICDKENHRIQVFQSDGTFVGKFGSIGSRPGLLEHPHYIAVSNTNRVIVSDSNNHRVQIFDVNGRSLSTFGTEGSEEGQFKFPRGIAVDDQGYIIVGDSGNNRIQIFNPDGSFLKSFGAWGSGEGEFKGLEGVAVTTTGNILVCDRENHRIQVF